MADKSEWKTPSMEGEGNSKGDGHQSQSQQLGNSPSEEEMGHWTPTGIEPTDYDDEAPVNKISPTNTIYYF